jgi:hypothetical protein
MRRLLLFGSWVPVALWAASLIYVRQYEGWGAWAAAPLLLPSLALSAAWAAAGLLLLAGDAVGGRPFDRRVLGATLVGGFVILYYTLRYLARPTG